MPNPKAHLSGPHGAGAVFAHEVAPLYGQASTKGSLVDVDRDALVGRMKQCFSAKNFEEVQKLAPELAKPRATYNPEETWSELRQAVSFRTELIQPYVLFPLDSRWIYYETESNLLTRRSPEFWEHFPENDFLVAVPQARRVSETRPLLSRNLVDWHHHDRGTFCFPRESQHGTLLTGRIANLAPEAWKVLRQAFGLTGDLDGDDAKVLVAQLFRCALAVLHAPRCEDDHRDALAHDWAHLPIPKDPKTLARLTALGERIAVLLDPLANAEPVADEILGLERSCSLGVIQSAKKGTPDLRLTIKYFGAAKGRWVERDFLADEDPDPAWGERTGDLYINPEVWLANVPVRVWNHELGGYPVLRKWLGYRSADRRGGAPLTPKEAQHLRSIVQRLAALLALRPDLDAAYEEAAANAFTAEELGLRV